MSVIQFCQSRPQDNELYTRLLKEAYDNDDTRMIFGNLFLQIAACEQPENKNPHESLLRRMLGEKQLDDVNPAIAYAQYMDLLTQGSRCERIHAASRQIAKDINGGNDMDRFFENGKLVDYQGFRDSDPVRLLLGSFFLKLAKCAPPDAASPYSDLLEKLAGDLNPPGIEQLKILVANFDKFRNYKKVDDPQGLEISQAMLGCESTQLVLGNMIINVAELSPDDISAPYVNLVQRLAGDARPDNFGQARSVANILDHGRNACLRRKNTTAEKMM